MWWLIWSLLAVEGLTLVEYLVDRYPVLASKLQNLDAATVMADPHYVMSPDLAYMEPDPVFVRTEGLLGCWRDPKRKLYLLIEAEPTVGIDFDLIEATWARLCGPEWIVYPIGSKLRGIVRNSCLYSTVGLIWYLNMSSSVCSPDSQQSFEFAIFCGPDSEAKTQVYVTSGSKEALGTVGCPSP